MATRVAKVAERQAPADLDGAFIINFDANPTRVRAALETLMEYLGPLPLTQDLSATIQIVLAEVLNNVGEHAYDGQGGPVYLRALVDAGRLTVIIRDRGTPLPPNLILAEEPDGFDPDDLPEGGFGWHLIRTLATELSLDRLARWNEMRLVFSLA